MKKLRKDIGSLVRANIGIGLGTAVVGGMGGNVSGLSSMAGMMPIVGTTVMTKHTMRMTSKLMPKKKRR